MLESLFRSVNVLVVVEVEETRKRKKQVIRYGEVSIQDMLLSVIADINISQTHY